MKDAGEEAEREEESKNGRRREKYDTVTKEASMETRGV